VLWPKLARRGGGLEEPGTFGIVLELSGCWLGICFALHTHPIGTYPEQMVARELAVAAYATGKLVVVEQKSACKWLDP
jgi:hypothetical protein